MMSLLRSGKNTFWAVLLIFLVVCGVFYAVVWPKAPFSQPDTMGYLGVADDLRDGQLQTVHMRTPGYALLLLISGSDTTHVSRGLFFIQLTMFLLSVVMLSLVLSRLSLSKWLLIGFVVLAVLPYNAVHSATALTETLTQFMLVGMLAGLMLWLDGCHWAWLLLSALCTGFAALVRPTYQYMFIIIPLLLLVSNLINRNKKQRILKAAAALFVGGLLIIGGFLNYNQCHFDYRGLTPSLGYHLTTRTLRVLERLPDEYADVREVMIEYRDRYMLSEETDHTGYMFIWGVRQELADITGLNPMELSDYLVDLNLSLIKSAPLHYFQEVGYSIINFWLPATVHESNFDSRALQLLWTGLHYLTVLVFVVSCVFLLGGVLWFLSFSKTAIRKVLQQFEEQTSFLRLFYIVTSLVIIGYTMMVTVMVDMTDPRHRVPIDVIIFTVIVLSIDLWFRLRQRMRQLTNTDIEELLEGSEKHL